MFENLFFGATLLVVYFSSPDVVNCDVYGKINAPEQPLIISYALENDVVAENGDILLNHNDTLYNEQVLPANGSGNVVVTRRMRWPDGRYANGKKAMLLAGGALPLQMGGPNDRTYHWSYDVAEVELLLQGLTINNPQKVTVTHSLSAEGGKVKKRKSKAVIEYLGCDTVQVGLVDYQTRKIKVKLPVYMLNKNGKYKLETMTEIHDISPKIGWRLQTRLMVKGATTIIATGINQSE